MPEITNAHDRNRRDKRNMLLITLCAAAVIAIVLYFAGAFMKSTG